MPVAGVVDALERIHAALVDGGALVDTQPVGARPPVVGEDGPFGTLDLREWAKVVGAIDREISKTIAARRFSVTAERHIVVTDVFDDLAELIDEAGQWAGTDVPRALARQVDAVKGEVRLHQDVRVRVLVKQNDESQVARGLRGSRTAEMLGTC